MKTFLIILSVLACTIGLSAQSLHRDYNNLQTVYKWTTPVKTDTVRDTVELGYYYTGGCIGLTTGNLQQLGYLTGINDTCTWTLQYIPCNHRGFTTVGRSWTNVTGTAVEILPGNTVSWYLQYSADYGLYSRFRVIRWRGTTQNFASPQAKIYFIRFD